MGASKKTASAEGSKNVGAAAAAKKKKSKSDIRESKRVRSRALNILNSDEAIYETRAGSRIFSVPSETRKAVRYTVNLVRTTCDCLAWRKGHKQICKHIQAARFFLQRLTGKADQSTPNACKNPPYYETMRNARRPILFLMLREIGAAVNKAA